MFVERNGKRIVFILICVAICVLNSYCLFAAGQGAALGSARYRVFSLKYISAEQGEKYLAELGVGTVSQLPGPNALLITGQAGDLIKASAILGVVDTEEHFNIKTIAPASEEAAIPSNEQIAAEIGNISIGTFSEPPFSSAKNKVIIDVCGDAVIAIATSGQLEAIVSAINRLRAEELAEKSELGKETITEADIKREEDAIKKAEAELKKLDASFELGSQVSAEGDESDMLFNELIESLAEKSEVEASEVGAEADLTRPAHPEIVTTTDSQTKQADRSAVGLARTEKSVSQTPEKSQQVEESDLPVIEKEPGDNADSSKAEPDLEVATEISPPLSRQRVRGLYEPEPITQGDEMLELDLPEKLNIIDLLDLAGKYLKLDYMYDETKVRGDVALRLQGPVKIKDLYPLLESVLKFRGFVMARKGNLVTIVPAGEALDIDPVLIDPNTSHLELGDVVITRIFELSYIDTTSAKNLLDGMKLGANVTPIEDAGILIVTGYAYRMGRVEKLLGMIDKPGELKKFKFRQLKYTTAETLAPKLEELAEQLGTVSVTIAAPSPDEPAGRPTRTRRSVSRGRPSESPGGESAVYLDADERTNRILMIGLKDQLETVDDLIDSLDVEQQDFRTLRLYDLQYVGAEEVVDKLKQLGVIGGSGESRSDSGRITRPGSGPAAAEQR